MKTSLRRPRPTLGLKNLHESILEQEKKKKKTDNKIYLGENLSEAPKVGLWVENLCGGSPIAFKKKKQKRKKRKKKKNTNALMCFSILQVID